MEKSKPLCEHTTCSRCGGSGHYSFNLMHGSRCYGCGGSGYKLTKRGVAANRWLREQRMVATADMKIGDRFLVEGLVQPNRWFTVMEVYDHAGVPHFKCIDEKRVAYDPIDSTYHCRVNSTDKYRREMTLEQRRELQAATLAYQATLTKEGVPSKRKRKSA
ncbi:hypothetical protein UFOVP820_21 [uncultured Caudovirales phage]|uniref:Uncharacterized protein n=1 Tax=uncultured Caudovirales phage TaxID=2100421 RepID=A0A6J5PCC0_9CAUD|nr:hypothetical protein UFOVP820_21 [uncultured Caudovirales phage]